MKNQSCCSCKNAWQVILGLGVIWSIASASVFAQQAPSPQQLLDAAHKATNLASVGAYILHADVVINAGGQPEHHAKLTIYRNHDRARVTLESEGKMEERVILRDKQLVVPGHGTLEAIGLSAFDQSWNPVRRMKFTTEGMLGPVSARKIHKRDAWCFDRKTAWEFSGKTQEIKSTLCFDTATGVLVRENSDQTTNQEFLDYASFGTAMYPRKVQILHENRAPIMVRQISVEPATLTDDTFKEPANSMEVESCRDEVSPKAIRTPEPEFPKAGSNARMQLLVYLYLLLNKEGKVAGLQPLTMDDYGFSQNAVKTVKTWQFQPATCNGRAVAAEMTIEVDFRLQRH